MFIMDVVLSVICGDNERLARQGWRQYRCLVYKRGRDREREREREREI